MGTIIREDCPAATTSNCTVAPSAAWWTLPRVICSLVTREVLAPARWQKSGRLQAALPPLLPCRASLLAVHSAHLISWRGCAHTTCGYYIDFLFDAAACESSAVPRQRWHPGPALAPGRTNVRQRPTSVCCPLGRCAGGQAASVTILPCKAKRQYLVTLQVSQKLPFSFAVWL